MIELEEGQETDLAKVLAACEPIYLLPQDDVAEAVISPALGAAQTAAIMMGYFSSSSLAEIAPGLARFLRSSSEPLKMVISPYLTGEDQSALAGDKEAVMAVAVRQFLGELPDEAALARHTLACLAWLVSFGRLQIKIAIVRGALFHSKIWLFSNGVDAAALHGSANMTGAGLGRNREQLSLSRSWSGDDARRTCARLQAEFDLLWGGGDENCIVVDLTQAIENGLIEAYKSEPMPSEDDFDRLWREANGVPSKSRHLAEPERFAIPIWLNYRTGDFAHQGEAVDAWQASGWRGILEMCTGSGKTLTAMIGAYGLHEKVRSLLIVVSAPYNVLLQQWAAEIEEFGLRPLNLSEAGGPTGRAREITNARRRLKLRVTNVEVLVVSNDTLCSSDFIAQIERVEVNKLLIADECHNLGAEGFIHNPPECFDYRLGLSATPVRQYDDLGSAALEAYFGPVCFSFTLEQAIGRCLTPYDYRAHFVELRDDEMMEWRDLSDQIARLAWKIASGVDDDHLNHLLLKRRRVLETAAAKITKLKELLDAEDLRALRHTLIYTTDKDPSQLDAVNAVLNERDVLFHQLTAVETGRASVSQGILSAFQAGDLQVLTAKRVLDEGVNVPQIERAYILASTTVRRQWVQRRGRLLRLCPAIGKTHSTIHDLVALPPLAEDGRTMDSDARKIINAELDRVWEFARLSRNAAASDGPFAKVEELRAMLKDRD